MKIERHIPGALLQPFIQSFLFIESEQEMENLLVPDTSLVMAIRFRGTTFLMENGIQSPLPPVLFSGLRKEAISVKYAPDAANLLVIFQPGGAQVFFREPLHELFGHRLQANFLQGYSDIAAISEQLGALENNLQRAILTEEIFLSKMLRPTSDFVSQQAITAIRATGGMIPIHTLAKQLFISQDALEKRFRQSVGTSPKHFASLTRLHTAIDLYRPGKSLTELAFSVGYYDQAHFIRDFKVFAHQTPGQFFQQQPRW